MGPKKRKNVCPNPLFLKWLEEWKDEAEEKGLNSKWTFSKALTSLKRYPLPLRSGKEAKILENIGDGIAKKLDKRLHDFLNNGGDPAELHQVDEPVANGKRKRAKKNDEEEFALPKSPNMKSPCRKYIPKYRSGPYALLVTLYQESKKHTYVGYLTKIELQTLAQPLCDTSFILPDPGSYYTAWSSMGHLLKKGLVLKWSSPAKFHITSTGCELAEMLLNGTAEMFEVNNSPPNSRKSSTSTTTTPSKRKRTTDASEKREPPPQPGDGLLSELHGILHELDNPSTNSAKVQAARAYPSPATNSRSTATNNRNAHRSPANPNFKASSHFERLQELMNEKHREVTSSSSEPEISVIPEDVSPSSLRYWYVNGKNRVSLLKSQALVAINETTGGVGFLIKARSRDLDASKVLYKVDDERPGKDGLIFAYLADKDAAEIATPPPSEDDVSPTSNKTVKTSQRKQIVSAAITNTTATTNNVSITSKPIVISENKSHTVQNVPNTLENKPQPIIDLVQPGSSTAVTKPSFGSQARKTTETRKDFLDGKDLQPIFSMYPGMFDVILLVDIVETTGSGKRKKEMADNLMKIGVQMEVRKLQLGDFLWVAKEKFGEQRELVLDFVVERKRMDDLASSIIDCRFKEQKFRLKTCGLKKLIYLVEQYGSVEHFIVPEATLRQAIMNTQVVDDLFVKETCSVQDSVQYLRLLTNQLRNIYSDKILHCLPMENVKALKGYIDFDDIISKEEQYLLQFHEFSTQTDKNKVLTTRELFCKQLMQMKGVSADRAVAIADKYPTPACLREAFEGLARIDEKVNLLTNVSFGNKNRKIGALISKQVYLHYTSNLSQLGILSKKNRENKRANRN